MLRKKKVRRTELVARGLISASTLNRLRNNENVSLRTLEILSVYLGCGITELFEVE